MGGELMLAERPQQLAIEAGDPHMAQPGDMPLIEQQPAGPDQVDEAPAPEQEQPAEAEHAEDAASQPDDQQEGADAEADEPQHRADPEDEHKRARVSELRGIIDELAGEGETLSAEARAFVRSGGSIHSALSEIEGMRGGEPKTHKATEGEDQPSGEDEILKEARDEYARTLVGAVALGRRGRRRAAAEKYSQAVAAKLQSKTGTDASQAEGPGTGEESGEHEDKDLAAEALSKVSDMVLKERRHLAEAVEQNRQESKLRSFMQSKVVRRTLIGAVVGTALAAQFHAAPVSESILHDVDGSLAALTSFLFEGTLQQRAYTGMNKVYGRYEDWRTKQRVKKDVELASLVERTQKAAAAKPAEDERGYTDAQAKAWVGSVYRRHREVLTSANGTEVVATETAVQYSSLVQTLVREEVDRQGRQLELGTARSVVFRAAAIACAVSFVRPDVLRAHEVVSLGSEVNEKLRKPEHEAHEE